MTNFLGIMQNEWAGAQAFSSFDTYLAPFVKVDKLTYKQVKQCIQSFIYGVNTPSYPKFVAMMFAAYIDGQYYSLKGDIPAFNGFAELAPASTTSAAPMRYSCAKWQCSTPLPAFRLGERIESNGVISKR